MSPFDWLNVINNKTEAEFDNTYNAFMINRGLSNHVQTVLYANEMNKNHFLDSDIQFNFYSLAIPKGKRFGKWHKQEQIDDINIIMEFYKIGRIEAAEYMKILSPENIADIIKIMGHGGK